MQERGFDQHIVVEAYFRVCDPLFLRVLKAHLSVQGIWEREWMRRGCVSQNRLCPDTPLDPERF